MAQKNTEADFWANYSPEPTSGCWLWTGFVQHFGHGNIRYNGRYWSAHRLAWTLVNGPIPDGMCVCHRCDVPACGNVDHLFLGTAGDNTRDMVRKGRNRGGRVPYDSQVRGESQPRSKLTDAGVVELRSRVANGEKIARICREYGVSQQSAWNAVHRITWRHVP